jgi:glutaredoxin
MKRSILAGFALLALTAAGPTLALFKVVGPDGRVTYTDRPSAEPGGRVSTLGPAAEAARGGSNDVTLLPPELREPATRYPVTLYAATDCSPCDDARRMLQQRGVPFSEKRIESNDDALALERLTGGRTVPAATIGAQALRGWNGADWSAFLDAAGYPRESRLPRGWANPPPAPLVARTPPPAEPPPARLPGGPPRTEPEPPLSGGFRF